MRPWKLQAIAANPAREWQTRRPMKPQPVLENGVWRWRPRKGIDLNMEHLNTVMVAKYAPYLREVVYLKEAWGADKKYDDLSPRDIPDGSAIWYKTSPPPPRWVGKWRSPMFMPAWAARYFRRIKEVTPQRLQDITDEDALAEGVTVIGCTEVNDLSRGKFIHAFAALWDSIYGKGAWDRNPWVWRIVTEHVIRDEALKE